MSLHARPRSAHLLAAILAAVSLGSFAHAGGVRIVDATRDRNYATIGDAIAGALPGEILLVGAGTYPGFVLDKPLTLAAAPEGADVRVDGRSQILGAVGGPVTVIGVNFEMAPAVGGYAARVADSEEVRFRDGPFIASSYGGGDGVYVTSTSSGVLDGCALHGGQPEDVTDIFQDGNPGGSGLNARESSVAVYASTWMGGTGGWSDEDGGYGGTGLTLYDSFLYMSASVSGRYADRIQLLLSPISGFQYAAGLLGVWHIDPLRFLPISLPYQTIPLSGSLDMDVQLPPMAAGTPARTWHGQGLTYSHPFRARLGNPVDSIQLNPTANPDCNGNGILDYIEVIDGSAIDADHDLIPDTCQLAPLGLGAAVPTPVPGPRTVGNGR